MHKFFFVFFITLILAGCGKNLRPDPSPASIISNYPNLEIRACGKYWNGQAMCSIRDGALYSTLNIRIRGYYKGSLTIVSTECGINQTKRYENSDMINIFIPGIADKDCTITITMSPELPKEENSGIKIHSFIGYIAVRRLLASDKWFGYTLKVKGAFRSELRIPVDGEGTADVYIEGCGVSYNKKLLIENGNVKIQLADAVSNLGLDNCVLDGAVYNSKFEETLFNVFISGYASDYLPLSIPVLSWDGNNLTITADQTVSIISIDNKYQIDREGKFEKIDPNKSHVARVLTIKGRLVFCFWPQSLKEWICLQ